MLHMQIKCNEGNYFKGYFPAAISSDIKWEPRAQKEIALFSVLVQCCRAAWVTVWWGLLHVHRLPCWTLPLFYKKRFCRFKWHFSWEQSFFGTQTLILISFHVTYCCNSGTKDHTQTQLVMDWGCIINTGVETGACLLFSCSVYCKVSNNWAWLHVDQCKT